MKTCTLIILTLLISSCASLSYRSYINAVGADYCSRTPEARAALIEMLNAEVKGFRVLIECLDD